MTVHVMALTYQPKIDAVKADTCRQTVRAESKVKEGDILLLHTWTGKPYRSKWDWRKYVTVTNVRLITRSERGWRIYDGDEEWRRGLPIQPGWRNLFYAEMVDIIKRDGIGPPTVENFEEVLTDLNGPGALLRGYWSVITWGPVQ